MICLAPRATIRSLVQDLWDADPDSERWRAAVGALINRGWPVCRIRMVLDGGRARRKKETDMDQLERESQIIEDAFKQGEITAEEYHCAFKELREDFQAMAAEEARKIYLDRMENGPGW